MESIIAECGENIRIEKILQSLSNHTNIKLTGQQKWELTEDIQENWKNIIKDTINVKDILGNIFPIESLDKFDNSYVRSIM